MEILSPAEEVLIMLSGTCPFNLNALVFTNFSCLLNASFMGLTAVELEAAWLVLSIGKCYIHTLDLWVLFFGY